MAKLYLEDLKVGDRFQSAEHALDAAQIKAFAQQFDPQPFHTSKRLPRAHSSAASRRAAGTRPRSR